MDVSRVNELGVAIQEILRLKTLPLGIKFFGPEEAIPDSFELITQRKVICNLIGLARFCEAAVAIRREESAGLCVIADIALGFGSAPADFAKRTVGVFGKNEETTAALVGKMIGLPPGSCSAIGVAPLQSITVVPDLVQIWGNPTQMLLLEYANSWLNAARPIELSSTGHGGSCYETLSWPLVADKIRLAIADIGDKRHGHAGDDEMILGVPLDRVEELFDGLQATQCTMNRLPVNYNFDDIPFPTPEDALRHAPAIKRS